MGVTHTGDIFKADFPVGFFAGQTENELILYNDCAPEDLKHFPRLKAWGYHEVDGNLYYWIVQEKIELSVIFDFGLFNKKKFSMEDSASISSSDNDWSTDWSTSYTGTCYSGDSWSNSWSSFDDFH